MTKRVEPLHWKIYFLATPKIKNISCKNAICAGRLVTAVPTGIGPSPKGENFKHAKNKKIEFSLRPDQKRLNLEKLQFKF